LEAEIRPRVPADTAEQQRAGAGKTVRCRPVRRKECIMTDCIFCKIVAGELPCVKVYENDHVLAFADINPVFYGHTLIIPKTHAENIWQISETDLAAVQLASKKVAAAIRSALNPVGVAMVQLNGRGVNQVVMHYHLHLIPRPDGARELGITKWEIRPGDMDLIRQSAEKIAAAMA